MLVYRLGLLWLLLSGPAAAQLAPPDYSVPSLSRGYLHLVYGAPDVVGARTFWIDLADLRVLHVSGANITLLSGDGAYQRGSAFEDLRMGGPGAWRTDEATAATLLQLDCPAVQAVILASEADRVTRIGVEGDVTILEWREPPTKAWQWSPEQNDHVQVEAGQRVVFRVADDGRILSWQVIVDQPVAREGRVHVYDYEHAVTVGGMSIPRYWDMKGKGRTGVGDGVLELQTAELLDEQPEGAFTREGAMALAAEIAQPMVETERASFQWYGDQSGETDAAETLPLVDPTRQARSGSLATALIASGAVVVALGGFAWWRSRR